MKESKDNGGAGGVYDLLKVKQSALKLAVEAAVTVLKVDQIIMSKPSGGPKMPGQ
jgi:T-complex protein 1 subunit theta